MANQKNREGFRHCSDCKVEFPLDSFANNKSDKQGKAHQCQPCVNKRFNDWYHANHEHALAYAKKKMADYRKRNMKVVVQALSNSTCKFCKEPAVRYIGGTGRKNSDPVIAVANKPRPVKVVEETIKSSTPTCLLCALDNA